MADEKEFNDALRVLGQLDQEHKLYMAQHRSLAALGEVIETAKKAHTVITNLEERKTELEQSIVSLTVNFDNNRATYKKQVDTARTERDNLLVIFDNEIKEARARRDEIVSEVQELERKHKETMIQREREINTIQGRLDKVKGEHQKFLDKINK